MGVNSLPKTVTQQCRSCNLNPGPTAPESHMLTTRLPSHPKGKGPFWERGAAMWPLSKFFVHLFSIIYNTNAFTNELLVSCIIYTAQSGLLLQTA